MNKVIQIERPVSLNRMSKQIRWDYDGVDLRTASHKALEDTRKVCQRLSMRGPTVCGDYVKASHLLYGSLLIVEQRVSKDLEISTVVGDLSKLAFPSNVMEIRFADPELPSILLCRFVNNSDMISKGFAENGLLFVLDTKGSGESLTLSLPDRLWKAYVDGQFQDNMSMAIPFDMAMDKEESEALHYMVMLAIKVIAYASVPHLAPALLESKAERKQAGVHPKHVIKNQSVFSIRYLPHVIRDKEETKSDSENKNTHRFLGRRGHIRCYENERFTKMRGQWQWLPPIQPPEGVQVIYKVRKPSV